MDAIRVAKECNDYRSVGRFERRMGRFFLIQGEYEKAFEHLEIAEKISIENEDNLELGRVWYHVSHIWYKTGKLKKAREKATMIINLGNKTNEDIIKILGFYRLGCFIADTNDGLKMLRKAEKLTRRKNWKRRLAWIMYRRSCILIRQNNAKESIPLLLDSLKMLKKWWEEYRLAALIYCSLTQAYIINNETTEALNSAEEAYNLFKRIGMESELEQLMVTLLQHGVELFQKGKYETADLFLRQCLKEAETSENNVLVACAKFGLVKIYECNSLIIPSTNYLKEAINIYNNIESKADREYIKNILKKLNMKDIGEIYA